MDKTDRLRNYGLAFLLYEQGLGICGYELIRELFIFVKLILNSYLNMVIGYTTGVYDMFHIGHLNILRRAKEQCDYLIVGVSTDELVQQDKHKTPIIPLDERMKIVEAIRYVDKVVPQFNKNKMEAWEKYHFNKMFVGSDWKNTDTWKHFEEQFHPLGVEIVYLEHTGGISSTILRKKLSKEETR